MKKLVIAVMLFLVVFCIGKAAFSGEQGHYSPAPVAVRDYAMPPKGFYLLVYDTYYSTDEFKNSSGDTFNSISVSASATRYHVGILGRSIPITLTGTLTADIDLNIKAFVQSPAFAWVTDTKILGADYGFIIAPSWGQTRVKVKADVSAAGTLEIGRFTRTFSAATSVEVKDDKTGFGDLFIEPVWLDWRGKHHDIGVNYGFYAPTGAYDDDDIANVGLGFWTHRLQANGYYYPFENKATAFMITPTYEWHSENIDKDVQPGQSVTLEYGISQYLHPRFEIGISGYHEWQVTDDSGSDAVSDGKKDMVSGAGIQATWWMRKDKCALVGKYVMEYGAKDRTEGHYGSINVTWIF